MKTLSLTIAELRPQIYYLARMKKLHAADAARRGCTVDRDVVVIAVAKFQYIFLSKLWIEFGVGLKYLPAHDTCSVVLAKKTHKIFSHFTPSEAVIKHRLLSTMAKRQHGKCGAH